MLELKPYQQRLARLLAGCGALFFAPDLRLKDGRPTPYFVNLGKLNTGRLALEMGRCFAGWIAEQGLAGENPVILGPSYKGSALALAAAMCLWQDEVADLAFDYDRKEAKTHGEASGAKAMFVTGALTPGAKVLIIDDVGTSMATKRDLLEKLDAEGERLGRPFEVLGRAVGRGPPADPGGVRRPEQTRRRGARTRRPGRLCRGYRGQGVGPVGHPGDGAISGRGGRAGERGRKQTPPGGGRRAAGWNNT